MLQPLPFRERGRGGWFTIPNIQAGERTLEDGIRGIEVLRHEAKGATVLDLGCAEGLISLWLIESGASFADGLDNAGLKLKIGKILAEMPCGHPPQPDRLHLHWCDFAEPRTYPDLREGYDIVLCLSILHKLADPKPLLDYAARKCRGWLAVRTPSPTLRTLDICLTLREAGFDLIKVTDPTPWVGIFRRCT